MSSGLSVVVLYMPSATDFGNDPELKDEHLNRHFVEDHPTVYTTFEAAQDAALMAASVVPTESEWPEFIENLASVYGRIPGMADLDPQAGYAPKPQAFVLEIAFGDVTFATEKELDSGSSIDVDYLRGDPDIIWLTNDHTDNNGGKLRLVPQRSLLGRFELLQVRGIRPRLRPPLDG